jgi:hypothetical protein
MAMMSLILILTMLMCLVKNLLKLSLISAVFVASLLKVMAITQNHTPLLMKVDAATGAT